MQQPSGPSPPISSEITQPAVGGLSANGNGSSEIRLPTQPLDRTEVANSVLNSNSSTKGSSASPIPGLAPVSDPGGKAMSDGGSKNPDSKRQFVRPFEDDYSKPSGRSSDMDTPPVAPPPLPATSIESLAGSSPLSLAGIIVPKLSSSSSSSLGKDDNNKIHCNNNVVKVFPFNNGGIGSDSSSCVDDPPVPGVDQNQLKKKSPCHQNNKINNNNNNKDEREDGVEGGDSEQKENLILVSSNVTSNAKNEYISESFPQAPFT